MFLSIFRPKLLLFEIKLVGLNPLLQLFCKGKMDLAFVLSSKVQAAIKLVKRIAGSNETESLNEDLPGIFQL